MNFPAPGMPFDERYSVASILGRGGFATVFAAVDRTSGRRVALKVLRPDDAAGAYRSDTRRRFVRELRALEQLRHPNIIEVLDGGESQDGLLFAAFELLEGRDLSALLEEHGRVSPDLVVGALRQLLDALATAHDRSLLHRDIKPQNIRVVDETREHLTVKLLDFGIARSTDAGHPSVTKTGELVGTPRYMSPEQLRGQPLGPGSDIYSLGLVAFELLLGTDVLAGNSLPQQLERLLHEHEFTVPELESTNPALLRVLQRMATADPETRFHTARAARRALAAAAPEAKGSSARDTRRSHQQPRTGDDRPDIRRRPLVVGGLLVGALVVGALIWWGLREPQRASRGEPRPLVVAEQLDNRAQPLTTGPEVAAVVDVGIVDLRSVERHPAPLPISAAASDGCGRPLEAGLHVLPEFTFAWVPEGYDDQRMYPVVIALHDEDGDPRRFFEHEAGLVGMADRHGVIVLAPKDAGLAKLPTDSKPVGMWGQSQDAVFLRQELTKAEQKFCIDRGRVFVLSHGRGATAASRVSSEPWVTGVALHSWVYRRDKGASPSDPVGPNEGELRPFFDADTPKPALWIWPEESAAVPLNGGRSCADERLRMSRSGVDSLWRQRNECRGPAKLERPDVGGACHTWECAAPFQSCVVAGGYPFPGFGRGTLGECMQTLSIEEPTKVDVAELAWGFFAGLEPASVD